MPTQPEITAPVSRGRNASIGVTENIGTSVGSTTGGSQGTGAQNTPKGGLVSNGVDSYQNVPKNPTTTIKDVISGGSRATVTVSSQSPEAIQDATTAEVQNEYVARTSEVQANSASAGYHTDQPSHNRTPVLPTPENEYNASLAEKTFESLNAKGIEASREFGSVSSDLDRIAYNADVVDENSNKKIDGADGPQRGKGDPTVQNRETELEYETNPDFPELRS